MSDFPQSTFPPPSFVLAECRVIALLLRAATVRLEALAAVLPESASDLRGVLEVAALDHLAQAVDGLDAALDV